MIDSLIFDPITLDALRIGRRVARMSDGSLWAVYVRHVVKDNIFVSKSTDGGATWGNEEQVTFLAVGVSESFPALAVDSHDNLHCVFMENVGGVVVIRYSTRVGGVWSALTTISNAAVENANFSPVVAVDSTDQIHVIFFGHAVPAGTHLLYYTVFSGGVWSVPVAISGTAADDEPSIAVDSADHLLVVWPNLAGEIMFSKLSGGVWADDPPVTAIGGNTQRNPEIAVDSHDNAWVSWEGKGWGTHPAQLQIVAASRTPAGVWSIPVPLLDDGNESVDASITIDPIDGVHVAFTYVTLGPLTYVLKQADYAAGVWGAPVSVTAPVSVAPWVLDLAHTLCANWPKVGGVRTNVINGIIFSYYVQDAPGGQPSIRSYANVIPLATLPIVQTDPATGVF